MSIITISRGSYSRGREVAQKAAERLGYEVLSRDVLVESAGYYNIPEVKLVRAIHDAPSILDRFTMGKQSFLACVRSTLANKAAKDNLVYHGLAGHLLLRDISHVVNVRIIADLETRAEEEMQRENIGRAEALAILEKDDNERRKWTQSLYGVDPWDPCLYDVVINIKRLAVDDAVDLVLETASRKCFATTPESQQQIDDLALACNVKAALVVDESLDVSVTSEFGNVLVYTKHGQRQTNRLNEKVHKLGQEIKGINNIEVRSGVPVPPTAV